MLRLGRLSLDGRPSFLFHRLARVTRPWSVAAFVVFALPLFVGLGAPRAEGLLFLSWNDCASSPLAASDRSGSCQASGSEDLYVAFELSQPADSVIGLEAVVDVRSSAATLPAWWQYAPGGCRFGTLIADADFSGRSACGDFWLGRASLGGPPVYTVGSPPEANQARITLSFAVVSSEPCVLAASTRYYAARLHFQMDAGTPCEGCEQPACLVLRSIRLARIRDTPGQERIVDGSGPGPTSMATWQGGGSACTTVPVRRSTWGQLKSLYR